MEPNKVQICKAQPIIADEPVQDTWIILDEEMPRFPSLEEAQGAYTVQGLKLEEALFETLPGGTYHALLVGMLKRKHSLLVVSEGGVVRRDVEAEEQDSGSDS